MATLIKDQKLVFKTNCRLMRVKGYAECSKGSILQYFRPSLSYYLSLRYKGTHGKDNPVIFVKVSVIYIFVMGHSEKRAYRLSVHLYDQVYINHPVQFHPSVRSNYTCSEKIIFTVLNVFCVIRVLFKLYICHQCP